MFKLKLLTPNGAVVKSLECSELIIPTVRGEINVLPNHTHILTELSTGVMTVKTKDGNKSYHVTHGLCKILKDEVSILAITSEPAEKIDVERAKLAKKKALEKLSGKDSLTNIDLIKFQRKLQRAEARLRAGYLHQ
ncbi:MAG: ATP synthase F1 subunit epsilon [Bacteriovoracaceae bacterium]|nr:ATP synthase F1 subunit epsilon [Bacteriovoracaceae bacterium]